MRAFASSKSGVGILLFLAVPLHAATLWLEPDPLKPDAGRQVQVRLMQGERFQGEEKAMDADAVTAFRRLRKNGRKKLAREEGARPVATYSSGQDGVEIVSLTWQGRTGGYYCKAVQVVGAAESGHPLHFSELGQRLEIVPQTDPVTLARRGGRLEVQVLYERAPLPGVRLMAMPKSSPVEQAVVAVSNEIGVASFDLTSDGPWLVEVNYRHAGERSYATLVLEAGAP
jgi:hypothetical protein